MDFYQIMGVDKDATGSEIKQAYRRLARRHHPDLNPGDTEAAKRFQELQHAYEVLSDRGKRRRYDRFGAAAFGAQKPEAPFGFDFAFDSARSWGKSLGELFSDLFAGGGSDKKLSRGKDIQYNMELSFEDSLRGVTATIKLQKDVRCSRCQGRGRIPSDQETPCPRCEGTGKEEVRRGPFRFSRECSRCNSSGVVRDETCEPCSGQGLKRTEERITVKIPAGVDEGSIVRLPGKGEAGPYGGESGDLVIQTHVVPHPFFERKNLNIYCEIPITFAEAALGARIPVPTIDGMASMKIPPGTQSGQVFRLREKGVSQMDGNGRGNQYVKVTIAVPSLIDEDSKELIRHLAHRLAQEPREKLYLESGLLT